MRQAPPCGVAKILNRQKLGILAPAKTGVGKRIGHFSSSLDKQFFFEKKNQKTSLTLAHGRDAGNVPGPEEKSFLLLFVHKKQRFLP
jgi:hypothetical protein